MIYYQPKCEHPDCGRPVFHIWHGVAPNYSAGLSGRYCYDHILAEMQKRGDLELRKIDRMMWWAVAGLILFAAADISFIVCFWPAR